VKRSGADASGVLGAQPAGARHPGAQPIARLRPAELAPLARVLGLALGYALLALGGPGVLGTEPRAMLVVLGLGLWAHCAARPGRGAFWIEWALAAAWTAQVFSWVTYVFGPALIAVAIGLSWPYALAGIALRRLAPRHALALAAPLAWTAAESIKVLLPMPFGVSWLQVGHCLVDAPWIPGSARVWGALGLSFAATAAGAGLAALAFSNVIALERWKRELGWGFAPFALAAVLAAATAPPPEERGPRLLLVQPGFAQERKQFHDDPLALYEELRQLSFEGLRDPRVAERPVDLVCWGETMLFLMLVDDGLEQAVAAGARAPQWAAPVGELELEDLRLYERLQVAHLLYGQPFPKAKAPSAQLPRGTSFLSGVEALIEREGELRRSNSVALWDAQGVRGPLAHKLRLVPGAESMYGLERFAAVRSAILEVAGYVPDFAAGARMGVLELATPARTYRASASVCFDNGFPDLYAEPMAGEGIDFHLVVSNEAWYRSSHEADQMLAFSRMIALQSARSVVRCTNSGVSVLIGPDGRERARLRDASGRDREVRGTLLVDVPVPPAERRAEPTLHARSARWAPWIALAAALGALLAPRRASMRDRKA
jgi:apolipoprotein N-acyltransferase